MTTESILIIYALIGIVLFVLNIERVTYGLDMFDIQGSLRFMTIAFFLVLVMVAWPIFFVGVFLISIYFKNEENE